MPFYRVNGTLMHLKLSGRKPHPSPCCARIPSTEAGKPTARCMAISTILCDWPLEGGGTCDAPLCEDHAVEVAVNEHLCPLHATRIHQAALQEPVSSDTTVDQPTAILPLVGRQKNEPS